MKSDLKNKAIRLRKKGLSYREIGKDVNVSKSTLSAWLKNIALSDDHRKRLYTKQILYLSKGSSSQKERRTREIDDIISKAEKEINPHMSLNTLQLMGAALYWAEGTKNNMFELTNSDPHLILFFVRWMYQIFQMPPQSLKARLNIYPQQNENQIKNFWSELTGIPTTNFGKSYVKPLSIGFKKNNLYYGTIRIEVPKSINIKHRVFGWIRAVLKNIDPDVDLVQRKWQNLREVERPANI